MKIFPRMAVLALAASLYSSPGAHGQALAQDVDGRTTTLVVGYSPGSTFDFVARAIVQDAAERAGHAIVIENRAGAGGAIGNAHAAKAAPDGRTLLLGGAGSHAVTPAVRKGLPYDPEHDFVPIVGIASLPIMLVVPADSRFGSISELLAYARENPGKLSFGSSGVGTSNHLAGELLKLRAGIDMVHVAYRDSNNMKIDLKAGRIDLIFDALPSSMGMIRQGAFKALATTSARRAQALPEVPTFMEAGVKDFAVESWIGLFGPKGLASAEVARYEDAFGKAATSPEGRAKLLGIGAEAIEMKSAAFGAMWLRDMRNWIDFVTRSGIKVSEF